MRILLLNAPTDNKTAANKDLQGGFGTNTHIGTGFRARLIERLKQSNVKLPLYSQVSLASILKESHKLEVIDAYVTGESAGDVVARAKRFSPDITFIASSIVGYPEEIGIGARVREATGSKIAFYGPMATVRPDIFNVKGTTDYIIRGEVENVALALADGKELGRIKGVSRDGKGAEAEVVKDLDALPLPAWELFPIEKYSYSPLINARPFVSVLASKGCPYGCNYCPYVVSMGRQWRNKSVARILEELEYITSKFGVHGVQFRDPIFGLDRKRVEAVCNGMIEAGYDIRWGCETRLDGLDKPLVDLMRKAGLSSINVGVESASDDLLTKATRKTIERSHQDEIIRYCEDSGVKVAAFYILGLLGETRQSALNTINYAKRLNTTVAQFTVMTPFPGSDFYKQMEAEGRIDPTVPLYDYDSYTPVVKHPTLARAELNALKEKAFTDYYFRPAYAAKFVRQKLLG